MIYCDMDGVLVDFDESFKKKYGEYPYNIPREQLWEIVNSTPDYWVNLPPQEDAHLLIEFLERNGFEILTGLPHSGFDKANVEKRQWIKNYIGEHVKVICCLSKDKQNYVREKGKDILIDDREPVIQKWQEKGGIGILHTSAQNTISELKKYGYK